MHQQRLGKHGDLHHAKKHKIASITAPDPSRTTANSTALNPPPVNPARVSNGLPAKASMTNAVSMNIRITQP